LITNEMLYTGVQVNYYFVCKRKLWFFSHGISMENKSEDVLLGKLLHNRSYRNVKKDILIDRISIDFVERNGEIVLHEIKKSRKLERSHRYQILYYLYSLKRKGVNAKGMINYPLLRKVELIKLEDENEIKEILLNIEKIISLSEPPAPEKKKFCRKCSYFELCWI